MPTPLPRCTSFTADVAPSRSEPCTSNNGPLVSDEECRRRFSEAAAAAAAEGRVSRALPGGLVREDLVISPSAGGDAPPAVLAQADLREGARGRALYFADQEVAILGKGAATTSGRSLSASISG